MKTQSLDRRSFLAATGTLGLAAFGALSSTAATQDSADRQFLVLQKYTIEKEEQKTALDAFFKDAAIPALNRLGIQPVGVFSDTKESSTIFVLLPHPTIESAIGLTSKLLSDKEFVAKGASVLDAPKSAPAYKEIEAWLMLAFKGMPKVELPAKGPNRIFQLRIYESPSLQTGQKKIEMFNDAGELKIFREVGLTPVFFGETLFGAKMPNLTYMLGFEDADAQKAAWGKFGRHPEWQKLRAMPEYVDSRIIRGITNLVLKPAAYSQI
jgi:hypothetical protein